MIEYVCMYVCHADLTPFPQKPAVFHKWPFYVRNCVTSRKKQ